jgi:hypothetical protein
MNWEVVFKVAVVGLFVTLIITVGFVRSEIRKFREFLVEIETKEIEDHED